MGNSERILFVVPTAYPLGGVAVWLKYIVDGLSKLDWDVYVGAVNGKYHKAEEYLKEYQFDRAVLISDVSTTRYGRITAISDTVIKTNADIVISVNIPDVFDAVAECKRRGQAVKSVMALHALEADFFQDIREQNSNIDAVIATNMLTKMMVAEYSGFPDERTFYAPYGVSLDKVASPIRNSDGLVLLYAGRLDQSQKRCEDLLVLVQSLEKRGINYEFLIAGDGPSREQLIPALTSMAKTGHITFLGQLSNNEFKSKVLPKADLLVLLSEWETGPIIIWEAMAADVAVLSSRYIGSGVEQALVDGENCFMFDIGDIEQAVDHIQNFTKPDIITSLKKEANKLVKSRYSLEASISAWDSVLKRIMRDIEAKPSTGFDTRAWIVSGRIEKIFGHRFAYWLRRYVGLSGYKSSAGDEWPHSYGVVDAEQQQTFLDTMLSLESKQTN